MFLTYHLPDEQNDHHTHSWNSLQPSLGCCFNPAHIWPERKWGRGLVLDLYWPLACSYYLEMCAGILHAASAESMLGSLMVQAHASESSQGNLDSSLKATHQVSILQGIQASGCIKGPPPHGEERYSLILRKSKLPCHLPKNLFCLLIQVPVSLHLLHSDYSLILWWTTVLVCSGHQN